MCFPHGCFCHPLCLMGVRVQLNLVASWEMSLSPLLVSSKSPGSEIKIYRALGASKNQLHEVCWLPHRSPAQIHQHTWSSAPRLHFGPLPLRTTSTKTENPGQMWGRFAAATHFYILKKKKKSHVHVEMRVCFPSGSLAPVAPWVQLTARSLKGSANPFSLLGHQPPPTPRGLAMGPVPPRREQGDLNVTPKTKM